MVRKILESCPSCSGALEITEVRCTRCETRVSARYRPCDFCKLSEEQSTFLRIFVTSRGNLSEVEKRLGVSYPTVRAKLDEIIGAIEAPTEEPPQRDSAMGGSGVGSLSQQIVAAVREALPRDEIMASIRARFGEGVDPGDPASPPPGGSERRAILDAVARGELSPEEGAAAIRRLRGEGERTDQAGTEG